MKRALVIIIDGVGIGELPDASAYGDAGSHTLGNLANAVGGLDLPNLRKLGLGHIGPVKGMDMHESAAGCYGKMAEVSAGKDSTTGHWELAGLVLKQAFPTYPHGFPGSILDAFKAKTGFDVLGNKPASGTEIIKELGEEHLRTGKPIVYTSADSVFQIAAHENVIPLQKLYDLCIAAREIMRGEHAVARVIARPFVGSDRTSFKRTKYRRDFSLKPFGKTLHDHLQESGWPTIAIGKINDLYAMQGISKSNSTKSNREGMQAILDEMKQEPRGLIMANLVDFDMLWGHRNDVDGFYGGLKTFDAWLPELLDALQEEDLLIITSDHGNDPTTPSTDHSREYVPLLVYGPTVRKNVNLGIRKSFADMQATLADYFEVNSTPNGTSFLNLILNKPSTMNRA